VDAVPPVDLSKWTHRVDAVIGLEVLDREWRGPIRTRHDSVIVAADGPNFPSWVRGCLIAGTGIPAGTTVVDVDPLGRSLVMRNPSTLADYPAEALGLILRPKTDVAPAKTWIGPTRLRPIGEAMRSLVLELQASSELDPEQTITVVASVRPDGHGRLAMFPLDLLAAGEDNWQGDALVSEPYTTVNYQPPTSPSTERTE
jgi:hypothetical protein